MVDRSKKQPAKHDSFPNTTLKSEWDVLAEIWDTLKKMPRGVEITLKHIKGHQDKEKSYAELSLPAQMNVDADRIAGDYIEANPDKNYSHALMFPSCGALIHLKNGTVTHHMKRALREAAHGEALEDYICKKNDGAPHVIDIIDWEAHRIALNRLRNYRSTLVKHMHNLLPVGKMVNRYDPKYRPNCPSCAEEVETCAHLIHCPGPLRQEWRNKLIPELREKLTDLKTDVHIMDLMLEGVYMVLHNNTDLATVPPGMEALRWEQEKIGWSELFKGRLAKDWARAQHRL